MNESMTSELQALRARAYGPDADLHEEPEALDRLRELEEIARGVRRGAVDASMAGQAREQAPRESPGEEPLAAASVDSGDPAAEDSTAEDSAAAGVGRANEPKGRWSAKRVAVVLITAVATAVVVTAAVTGVISRRVQADPREVAVLAVDPVATLPPVFGGWQCVDDECTPTEEVTGTVFTEFYGLSALTLPARFMGADEGSPCLVVMDSSQMEATPNTFSGRMYQGCGAGEFPAAVQISVSPQLPEELRDEFPEGSGLQFVLQGDEVVVLSDTR